MPNRYWTAIGAIVSLVFAGCDGSNGPKATQANSMTPLATGATPTQTVEQLHKLRELGRYTELGTLVERTRASGLIDFLLAMDELMSVNDEVQAAIRKYAPAAPAREWDLRGLENRQGLLSTDVRVIDEHIEGPQAWVTIQVGETVPLEIVPLRRIDGRWIYWPEGDVGGMPEALRRLSRTLERVAHSISHEELTEQEIHTEFRLRISPHLKAIQSIAAAQTATQAPAVAAD